MNNLKFHTLQSLMYSESRVWSIFRHASGTYIETHVFYKENRGIEHGRSFGEGKVRLLLPLRETVVHVRQTYAAEVRYFPPSEAVMRNWNIIFHNICAV